MTFVSFCSKSFSQKGTKVTEKVRGLTAPGSPGPNFSYGTSVNSSTRRSVLNLLSTYSAQLSLLRSTLSPKAQDGRPAVCIRLANRNRVGVPNRTSSQILTRSLRALCTIVRGESSTRRPGRPSYGHALEQKLWDSVIAQVLRETKLPIVAATGIFLSQQAAEFCVAKPFSPSTNNPRFDVRPRTRRISR